MLLVQKDKQCKTVVVPWVGAAVQSYAGCCCGCLPCGLRHDGWYLVLGLLLVTCCSALQSIPVKCRFLSKRPCCYCLPLLI